MKAGKIKEIKRVSLNNQTEECKREAPIESCNTDMVKLLLDEDHRSERIGGGSKMTKKSKILTTRNDDHGTAKLE
jgi:hypothetical protein